MSMMTPAVGDPMVGSTSLRDRDEILVRELHERLRAVRGRQVAQRLWIGAASVLSLIAVCVAGVAIADYWCELAIAWRVVGLISILAGAIVLAIGNWRYWISQYSLSRAAADAEASLEEFGQRLRTTLDYEQQVPTPAAASPALLSALHRETHQVALKTDWDEAINSQPLFLALLGTFLVGFVWLIALAASPEFRTATGRTLLMPLEYTKVTYSPQETIVKQGESATIKMTISGRPISKAELSYWPPGKPQDKQNLELKSVNADADIATISAPPEPAEATPVPVPLLGDFEATFKELQHDVTFSIVAGPKPLPEGSIRVLQPLKLEQSEAKVFPPAYTGRKPQTVKSLDLKVLEGANVELQVHLNRAAATARLTRVLSSGKSESTQATKEKDLPLDIPLKPLDKVLFGTLKDLRQSVAFTLSAEAADGMTLDPIRVNIRVQMDRKPHVEFIQPPEELVVTPTTEVPIVVEAGDDIGLHKVGILYQVGSGTPKVLAEQDAVGSSEPFRIDLVLMLEELQVTHQDAITYHAFAEDNYFGKPRRTTTPLRFIDIRPYRMKFQVVDQQGEPCNCTSITLEELIARQRLGLKQAFALQDEAKPAKETTDRLSKSQSEVLTATKEFADGMAARGAELPALDDALQAMAQAVAALDVPQVSDAVTAEQQALAGLIKARENVRQKLNQSSSPSASAARKFDRQQRQKLRMPEKKQADQQQQLAKAREKLDDLAKRERKWSEDIQTSCNCNNPSQSSKSSQSKSQSKSQSQSKSSSSQQSQSSPMQDAQQQSEQSGNKPQTPTPAEMTEAQKKLQQELADLTEDLKKLDRSEAAQQQAKEAAESMQRGLEQAQKEDGESASKAGQRSAEQIEQLSNHLAALNARDFGQRLDQAQKLAQQLTSRQENLEKRLPSKAQNDGAQSGGKEDTNQSEGTSGTEGTKGGGQSTKRNDELAQEERSLATQTDMLAELLDKLKPDADIEMGAVREKLDQVQSENPPRDIAGLMRQAADDLQEAKQQSAGQAVTQAKERLQELSKSLGAARSEYAQPQLKELLALEEQLAQLQQQAKRAKGQGNEESSALKDKWRQLAERLEQLAAGDKRLAEALRQMREGSSKESSDQAGKPSEDPNGKPTSNTGGQTPPKPNSQLRPNEFTQGGQQMPDGFYSWLELGDFHGVAKVSKVLQTKIQEAILAGALMDADQPVPPAYKELVEQYYKTLSDDLK